MEVTVTLKNPPAGANKWQMRVVDDVGLRTLMWGADAHDNIKQKAVFKITPEWLFELAVDIVIYEEWQEDGEWHARQLYKAQSIWPYLWDWDKWDWSTKPDPTYREIFIPDYGDYYYNVAVERFEIIAVGYAGSIVKKELEYDESRKTIPAY